MKRVFKWILRVGLILLALIQLVPYGRDHATHPDGTEPKWNSPRTRELALRACFDCHSNQTRWPWYSWIAPASWLVQHDVDEGRRELNFSEWVRTYEEAGESAETVLEGEMPPWTYTVLHGDARLTPDEQRALADG